MGKQFNQFVRQEGVYSSVALFAGNALDDVLTFWRDCDDKLGLAAKTLLSIPASAAAPERYFSLIGRAHSKGRARMSAETACQLGHIKVNRLGSEQMALHMQLVTCMNVHSLRSVLDVPYR